MTLPPLPALLTSLRKLPHSERVSQVVSLALAHRARPELAAWLDALAAESTYHTRLVLPAAVALNDTARLQALIHHPNVGVQVVARRAAPLPADATSFVSHYLALPLLHRGKLAERLRRERRSDLVEALLAGPLGDYERARLLVGARAQVIAELLPELGDLVPNLRLIAQLHPDVVLDELARRLTGLPPAARPAAWRWAAPAWEPLTRLRPAAVVELVAASPPPEGLPEALRQFAARLLRAVPGPTVAVLTASPLPVGLRRGPRPHLTHALRVAFAGLPRLLQVPLTRAVRDDDRHVAAYLAAVPPSDRAELFAATYADVELATREWDEALLHVLPHAERLAQADRQAQLPDNSDLARQLALAAFRAPAVAWEVAESQLRAADADVRSAAWRALLGAAGRSRRQAEMDRVWELLPRAANEQDPVRQAIASALSLLPAASVAAGPAAPLAAFVRSVAEARDTSDLTRASLRLALWRAVFASAAAGPVPTGPDSPLAGLALLANSALPTSIPHLALPPAARAAVVAALLPPVRAAARHGKFRPALLLWEALGRHAYPLTPLVDLVHQALAAPERAVAEQAACYWLADPATRAARLGQLVHDDASWVVVGAVAAALADYRQDLVPLLLAPSKWRGRFANKHNQLPLLTGSFSGWLPQDVAKYAALLRREATNQKTAYYRAVAVAKVAVRLPEEGIAVAEELLAAPQVQLQEIALAGLAHTHRPEPALELLLTQRGTDRARVAMYSLAPVVAKLPPEVAAQKMAELASDEHAKLTSRKEAVRLLARLRPPTAPELLAAWAGDAAVPEDVRIAAARALLTFLDFPEAFGQLAAVATLSPGAAWQLSRTPPTQLSPRHRARFAEFLTTCPARTEIVNNLAPWGVHYPPLADYLANLALGADVPVARLALEQHAALLGRLPDWASAWRLARALAERAAAGPDVEPVAGPVSDLPHWQRLRHWVGRLVPRTPVERQWQRGHLTQLATQLQDWPLVAELAWPLLAAAIDWQAPAAPLRALAAAVRDPLRVGEARALVTDSCRLAHDNGILPPATELAALVEDTDAVTAGLALAVVAVAGPATGWAAPWRAHLVALRSHPVAAVRAWARHTVTEPFVEYDYGWE
ncbi:hypothetical protein [Buchananella hordeovulneris]|uniref:hypothetical protein n=1 Tax=Buchananella hordeovulneris TaxID=52770 RepID=UPI000F5F84E7|nr:hypothetical protein [Buchananella hordeovulneris]RRD42075.1 hypothetical protein EII13_10310 [Buchananella hordeovulneris]